MPKFSAVPPNPETTGDFEEMALLAGSDAVKRIRDVRPEQEVVQSMMTDARALATA